jgi:delta 1-pyrroline-5-carboxylate dehydrogenase
VLSPVCVAGEDGLHPLRLGSHPRLDAAEALKALDAAVAAYDRGRGIWPTMSVADRIAHVEAFLAAMCRQRDRVIRLIMLEIGKTLKDSTAEFERTIKYVEDTIGALKDLDRTATACAGDRPLNETLPGATRRRAQLTVRIRRRLNRRKDARDEHDHHQGRHADLLQGLGQGSARCFQPWLAA